MVDTGGEHTVVTQPMGPLSQRQVTIVGAMGNRTRYLFLLPQRSCLGSHEVICEFLYFPNCPTALMGWDLLGKSQVQISFNSQDKVL